MNTDELSQSIPPKINWRFMKCKQCMRDIIKNKSGICGFCERNNKVNAQCQAFLARLFLTCPVTGEQLHITGVRLNADNCSDTFRITLEGNKTKWNVEVKMEEV